MKIEKINENQIKCTLTREDLAAREIRISELAYGSEKAKQLFQDMMQQAFQDCGFEVNNTPLMIEAIPVSMDAIILIITKVDDPEELDSRFSRFSQEDGNGAGSGAAATETLTGVDDVLDLITKLTQARKAMQAKQQSEAAEGQSTSSAEAGGLDVSADPAAAEDAVYHLSRFYLFRDMENIIRGAHALDPSYDGISSLYKNPEDGNYYLILRKGDTSADLFNKVCNVLSEYGLQVDYMNGIEQLFSEHMQTLLTGNALTALRQL